MKKQIIIALVFLALQMSASAQTNLQTFYDFGKDRGFVTTTLEGFYGDNWGSTFFFIDYDYSPFGQSTTRSPQGSYFEIARGINLWRDSKLGALSAHIEYNGGVGFGNSNWLFGAEWFMHSEDFSKTLTFELMYKTFNGNASSDVPVQFTVVWGVNSLFGLDGLTFSGFADLWGENTPY